MGTYDLMQVCKNGHKITDRLNSCPQHSKEFCDRCGAETIYQCPKCKEPIKGYYDVPGVMTLGSETPIPHHCHKCGEPYPWAKDKKELEKATKKIEHNPVLLIENLCNKFHLIVRQIRQRHDSRPTLDVNDEYDVQDLFHTLLKIYFDDIRDEEWTPSYAGSCSRVDFLLKKEQIVVEVKKTRTNLKDKELGEQLIVDIEKYKTHPDCKKLVCFVYDPEGYINKPSSIENDLSYLKNKLEVKTIIVPKGY